MAFELHPQLAQDSYCLGHFPLSLVLLSKDAQYPWLILVPQRAGAEEIYQLEAHDQQQLLTESSLLSQRLAKAFNADKMNVAALGNVVPQLHVHHVVRYQTDPAWPAPIWGAKPATTYTDQQFQKRVDTITLALRDTDFVASPILAGQ